MGRPDIGRLNLGPVPTSALHWDQPHEGNIFTHLYQQRAFHGEVRRERSWKVKLHNNHPEGQGIVPTLPNPS